MYHGRFYCKLLHTIICTRCQTVRTVLRILPFIWIVPSKHLSKTVKVELLILTGNWRLIFYILVLNSNSIFKAISRSLIFRYQQTEESVCQFPGCSLTFTLGWGCCVCVKSAKLAKMSELYVNSQTASFHCAHELINIRILCNLLIVLLILVCHPSNVK
jgi:hypothetical protein